MEENKFILVPKGLAEDIFKYLNQQPRFEVNNLCELFQSCTIIDSDQIENKQEKTKPKSEK